MFGDDFADIPYVALASSVVCHAVLDTGDEGEGELDH